MKREDLRAIEGMTDAQVDAVMALAGRDSTAAHAREEQLQQQLTIAQQGLAAFGTQKPTDLAAALQQVQQLQTQLNDQAASYRFREFARNAAQDAGAIDAADVVGLLEQDEALRGSTNLDAALVQTDSRHQPAGRWAGWPQGHRSPAQHIQDCPRPGPHRCRLRNDGLPGPHGAQGQEPGSLCRPLCQDQGSRTQYFLIGG